MAKDAFFRLDKKSNGTYIVQYPPIEGGSELVNGLEVIAYLDKKLGAPYEKAKVAQFFSEPVKTIKSLLLTTEDVRVLDEYLLVEISEDKNAAYGELFPPMEGGNTLTPDDVISALIKAGVKYGVDNQAIEKLLTNKTYVKKVQLASSTLPVDGKEAVIKYNFNTDLTMKPQANEDGSVDFHHLDMISPVTAGQLLAELTPANMGKPGINVCGQLLKQVKVRNKILRVGKNIKISEDGLRAYSEINGHASLEGEMIFVSNTYEVPANVDASTGDIDFDGDVLIHGNVNTGYSVFAKGDIIVEGVVEGARLEAGGNIILKRGISGMDKKGNIKAGLNIISKFIESAVVTAGGYVTSDSIMHSEVSAKGDVNADGKKGFISGGYIYSGTLISARNIGSSMGTTTILECGIDSAIIDEYHNLEKEINDNYDEEDKLMPPLSALVKRMKLGEKLDPVKLLQLKKMMERRDWLHNRNDEINARRDELKELIDNYVGGRVRAEGTVHVGSKIVISNSVYYVKADTSYCSFTKEAGEVKLDVFY